MPGLGLDAGDLHIQFAASSTRALFVIAHVSPVPKPRASDLGLDQPTAVPTAQGIKLDPEGLMDPCARSWCFFTRIAKSENEAAKRSGLARLVCGPAQL